MASASMSGAAAATALREDSNEIRQWATIGSRAGFWAAVCWAGMGVESVLRPWQDNRRDTFWMLPFALTMVAFYYLHKVQKGRSRTETVGFWMIVLSSTLLLSGSLGIQLGIKALQVFGFPGGPIVWTIGLVAFGVGTWIAGRLPRPTAVALILLEPFSVVCALALSRIAPLLERGAYSGNIGKGTSLAVVAWGLKKVRENSVAASS